MSSKKRAREVTQTREPKLIDSITPEARGKLAVRAKGRIMQAFNRAGVPNHGKRRREGPKTTTQWQIEAPDTVEKLATSVRMIRRDPLVREGEFAGLFPYGGPLRRTPQNKVKARCAQLGREALLLVIKEMRADGEIWYRDGRWHVCEPAIKAYREQRHCPGKPTVRRQQGRRMAA